MKLAHAVASSAAVIVLLTASPAPAQTTVDPSGHWEGMLDVPDASVALVVDLAKTASGGLAGTISMPSDHVKGLPLTKLVVTGRTIAFANREDQVANGTIADDGKTIRGVLDGPGFQLPFRLTRTGDAQLPAVTRNEAVAKTFEGEWVGTLHTGTEGHRLVLTIANHPDGTSTATIVNRDEGNLAIPASAIAVSAPTLTLDLGAIDGAYTAALSPDGTELIGTFSQGSASVPVTFQRRH